MSWDAYLTGDRGHSEGEWNYTHNCNGMIEAALGKKFDEAETSAPFWVTLNKGPNFPMGRGAWWDLLDGLSGPEGAALLDYIVKRLEADPAAYEAMNPENGWGSYETLLKVLCEMRDAVPEWPTTWSTSG